MLTAAPSPSSSLSTLAPGAAFRQYRLLEQIGVGGQAVVWSALDERQDRICAIKFNKILDADEGRSEELGIEHKLERLLTLQHPHILPLEEYGSEERVRFMVSPYIPGGTLTSRVKTAPLSFDEVLTFGAEIASALDYLHSQGVIHRDLKASNILMDLSHHTYLADFGLARLVSTSTLAFHTGHGTPPYSPPEQIRSKEITPKSDIFSFGILLFEMFTGQLPWNGQRQLGVEQLHSKQELPDPCEYVTGLPPLIKDVLRRVTAADPDLRPRSAGEVMRMIYYVFNVPADSIRVAQPYDEQAARQRDAEQLLTQALTQWEASKGKYNLGLTRFALIHLQRKNMQLENVRRFMLSQALTYGHGDDHWWAVLKDPRERLLVAAGLLGNQNEVIAARILRHLTHDPEVLSLSRGLPKGFAEALLAIGLKTHDANFRRQILGGIRILLRPGSAWSDSQLHPEQGARLGELALEDSRWGDAAAELIGHVRSASAVRSILSHGDDSRKVDALLLIQRVAGSLPSFVPRSVRSRLALEWILQRLTQQPVSLIGAYALTFLGAALGIGLQVYLTYNLPNFFDTARLATSLEQGLIIGSVLGFGIFLPRVITERFPSSSALLRVFLGTLVGAGVMNIAMLVFHLLFLNTPASGFLITLGCLLIAFTFALGGLIRSRLMRMALSALAIFLAILGTWLIHTNFAASSLELTPLLRYRYVWPLTQVAFTALLVTLPIAVFANLIDLSLKEEDL